MENESRIPDPVDPLRALSGLSLFPRTTRASSNAALPSDPKDLESIHNFMKSVSSSSPETLLDQAKAIVDGGSELLNAHFTKFVESMGIDKDGVAPNGKEKPQERRPGLGRKRARFSLKPNTSQPSVNLVPNLDIFQLQDPEEFFSAYEKLENAKKEIQKQRGGSASELKADNPSTTARCRRPGILGKSASYKHRFSSVLLEMNDMLMSSQETLEPDVLTVPGSEPQQETSSADVETEEIDMEGSITGTEKRVNKLLDELLSRDIKDLEGDGALSLLKERLQIKPIDLGNLSIPEFNEIGRTDFKALGELLPRSRKSVLHISNLVKNLSGGAPKKHVRAAESPTNPIASPTPLRSPFASISLLKKSSSQLNPLRDPFSPLNVDFSEPKSHYSVEEIDKQSERVDVLKDVSISANLRSLVENETDRPTVLDLAIHKVVTRVSESLTDKSVDKNLDRQTINRDARPSVSHEKTVECNTARSTEINGLSNGPDKLAENVLNRLEVAVSSGETHFNTADVVKSGDSSDAHMYQSSQAEENFEDIPSKAALPACPDVNIQKSTFVENHDESQSLPDFATPTASEECAVDKQSAIAEIDAAKIPETQKHPLQKRAPQAKRPRGEKRLRKEVALRPSLADAGTSFDSGVRRSKRIKTRPLEYWKGERFLYGRVNESIKLVGLKYISPAKGDGNLKVKSFVSHDYDEILQQAACY